MSAIKEKPVILIVDDQPEVLNSLERLFKIKFCVMRASRGEEALAILDTQEVAVILTDQKMPQMTGVQMLVRSMIIRPHAVRILITAYADIHASISAVNEGQIFYYISKPWEPDQLMLIVERAAERYRLEVENRSLMQALKDAKVNLENENTALRHTLAKTINFDDFIGNSPKMMTVFKLASKVLHSNVAVMITGETGTGKELLAKAIHAGSDRNKALLVTQNCGALPDSLLESELFGHVKGSFTGAISNKKGLFELADGGTIFLDEVGDTSPAMQLRLLRVLQEGEIRPVGAEISRRVDIRVIAATHRNLEEEVKAGRFREDLFYRLNVFPIHLPPLRERREDISELAMFFLDKFSKKAKKTLSSISDDAMKLLFRAPWPGNIRELENEIERAVTLAEDGQLLSSDLLSQRLFNETAESPDVVEGPLKLQVESLEKRLIGDALLSTGGNILKAAEILGLSRPGLHKKLDRYKLHP
ncbi:sigma-54-dependent Fis family transcriptional regulator [bacterium]|nr:sigma-54-dependent Fis family transcriptional regulator [bacterium]